MTTKAPIDRYIDKEHAVGAVWCLEDHFRRISKRLDEAGVPKTYGEKKLTVFQRVSVLAQAIASFANWNYCLDSAWERDDWKEDPLDGETIALIVAGELPDPHSNAV